MKLCYWIVFIGLFYLSEVNGCRPPCCFEDEDGIIDLSTLASKDLGAEFQMLPLNSTKNINDSAEHTISYNPCKQYTDTTGHPGAEIPCINVAACRHIIIDKPSLTHNITQNSFGTQDSVSFTKENNTTLVANYSSGTDPNKYILSVQFHCNSSALEPIPTLIEYENEDETVVILKIDTVVACPTVSPPTASPTTTSPTTVPPPIDDDRLSPGSITLIVFVVVIFVYIFGGMLYNKIVAGAEGVELFPHHEFWTSLPGLVFDGLRFACSCCRSRNRTNYDNM